ncbi:CatB-related O-acetyltransferase [Sphingomonas sp. Leaf62]|uniref:CatB-related O-acetyltransferase n=1 Tax=Sphingomonas sp. Leaf62 TaxID=1736228 RepID=UPI0006F4E064|nr:CatB-related O-acetyltransferase [Sphingomonas sp. Leaf62]KQN73009.1 hypothetical protein ASE91_18360 [Sphingomonas sp. Leaf62]
MQLDTNALKSVGIDLAFPRSFDIWGDAAIESPVFCASNLRFDTFLRIGAFSNLNASTEIGHTSIGRYTSIAQNCFIGADRHPTDWISTSRVFYVPDFRGFSTFVGGRDPSTPFSATGTPTRIGNDVLIANSCIINRGITIGDGAIVAPGSVVTKDVPTYAIAGGNPARVLRYRFPDAIIAKLLDLQWWNYSIFHLESIDYTDIGKVIDRFEEVRDELTVFEPGFHLTRENYSSFLQ